MRSFDVDFLEVAQPLQTGLGLINQVSRSPAPFHLPHFTAQNIIFCLGVTTEVDPVYISALARVYHKGDGHGAIVMGFRYAIDVGEGIAFVTQATGDQLGRSGHHFTREHLALLDQQQGAHFFFRHLQLTAELDLTHGEFLAFIHVDGDVDVLLVWGNGHLRRADIHVDIATIQVIGTQAF